jgi:hypothetical protein
MPLVDASVEDMIEAPFVLLIVYCTVEIAFLDGFNLVTRGNKDISTNNRDNTVETLFSGGLSLTSMGA